MDHLFWLALGKIIWIDVLLSGDNAVVIALAASHLPPRQRLVAMVLGTVAAVMLRVGLTGADAYVLMMPYLQLAGGLALLYIAAKLLVPDDEEASSKQGRGIMLAILTIVAADISMSIDNIIAIAAASHGNLLLLALGLALSIPLVIGGAYTITKIVERFPVITWAGAALLGWIAGETIIADPAIASHLPSFEWPQVYGAAGAITVLVAGTIWRQLSASRAITKLGASS